MKRLLAIALFSSGSVQAANLSGFDLTPYGFIKTSANYADGALASFNNINQSAPTHAVAQTRDQDRISRFSFQAQQTRLGLNLSKAQVQGKVEFDFIDFSKSSPTTQMVPRVRIATVSYTWDQHKIIMGQDWDLFSPTGTYSFNFIGNYFMAGNTGFMRQQLQYLRESGEWEFGGALGMAGNNPGNADSDLELGKVPSYALRILRKLQDGKVGFSTIYSSIHYSTSNKTSHDTYGYNAFFEKKFGEFSLKSEAYYGQNLANTGTLALGRGTNTLDVKEFGGTLTGMLSLTETHVLFGGLGAARVEDDSELAPFTLGPTGSITAPGVKRNFVSRIGYEHKISTDLSWMNEISRFETTSKISDSRTKTEVVYGLESGLHLKF